MKNWMQSAKRGIVLLLCGIMVWNLAYNSNLVVSAQDDDTATIQTEDVSSSTSGNDALETPAPSDGENDETGTKEGTEDDDNSVGDDLYEEDSEDGIALMAASDELDIMVADDASDLVVDATSIKYKDGSNWKDLTEGTYLKYGTEIRIDVAWSLLDTSHDTTYVADLGITSLTIPNTGEIDYNLDSRKVATYSVTDGKFTLNIANTDYQNNESGRNGGFTMNATFTGAGTGTPYGQEYNVSVLGKTIKVKYDDATSASSMDSVKTLDGALASDGTQGYKITLTAKDGAVHGISLTDTPGNGLSDMSAITVTDAGETGLAGSYANFEALNAALKNVTLAQGKTIALTYTMKADTADLYLQNPTKGYDNNLQVEYTNNHNETKKNWNSAGIRVSKPTVSKWGKTSDDGTKITWTIEISLADKDSHDESKATSDELKNELNAVITDFKDEIPEGCSVTSVSLDNMTASYDSGSKKYKLTYETAITTDYQNKPNQAEIKNTVSYKIDGTSYSATGSAYTIGKPWITKEVVGNSYNPTDNTVQWKITLVNVPEGITDVKLQESPDSQQTVQSIKIGNTDIVQDGSIVTGNDIAEDYSWGKLTFKNTYISAVKGTNVEVLVTTKLNSIPTNNNSYTNTAYLSYKPDSTSSETTINASDTWKYKTNLTKSGQDNGDGTITYTVTANYKDWCDLTAGLTGTNRTFQIKDVYDENLKILDGSLTYEVKAGWNYRKTGSLTASEYNINAESHTLTMSYTLTDADIKGILNGKGAVSNDYADFKVIFSYKAKPKDTLAFVRDGVKQTYTNSASGTFGTDSLGAVVNQTSLNPSKVITKTMNYDSSATTADERKKVSYTVVVNPDKLDLVDGSDKLEITDTLKTTDLVYNDLSTIKVKVNGTESTDFAVRYGTDNNQLIFTVPDSAKVEITYSAKIKDRVYNTNSDVNTSNQVAINALGALSGSTATSRTLSNVRMSNYIRSASYSLNLFKCSEAATLTALSGAEFTLNRMIYDTASSKMNVDSSFTQRTIQVTAADGISAIENLTSNELYMLKETKAPEGYAINDEPYYFIYYNGAVTPTTYSGYTVHEFEDKGTLQFGDVEAASLKLVKVVTGGTTLTSVKNDLTFNVKTEDGTVVRTVSGTQLDTNGSYTINDLKPGTYTVEEVIATSGTEPQKISYQIGTAASLEGKTTGGFALTANEVTTVTYTNQYDGEQPLSLKVSKTDIGGTEVAGATIALYKSSDVNTDGTVKNTASALDSWTSSSAEASHDFGSYIAKNNSYVLVETGAPNGYAYSENIAFTVAADGTVSVTTSGVSLEADGSLKFKDKAFTVNVNKTNLGGTEIAGATIKIYKAKDVNDDGTVKSGATALDSWVSAVGAPHDFGKVLQAGQTYVLVETGAPSGYAYSENITFKVNDNGIIQAVTDKTDSKAVVTAGVTTGDVVNNTITMKDAATATEVKISKKAVNGTAELPGATLTLYQKSGSTWTTKTEWKWVSTTTEKTLSLEDGEYKLEETTAPNGYAETESIEFTIASGALSGTDTGVDGSQKRVTMRDKAFTVNVNKTNLGGTEIAGATIKIYKAEDVNDDGTVKSGATALDSWVSAVGAPHDFGKVLQAGQTYVLVETGAPSGYAYSENITFKVNDNGTVQAVAGKTDSNAVVTAGAATGDVVNNTITMKDAAQKSNNTDNDSSKDTTSSNTESNTSNETVATTTITETVAAAPKTGDDNQLVLWSVILVCAAAGIGVLARNRKKSR